MSKSYSLEKVNPSLAAMSISRQKKLTTLQNCDKGPKLFIAQNMYESKGACQTILQQRHRLCPKLCAYTPHHAGDVSLTWYMYAKLKHSSRSRRSPQPPHPLKPA